MVPFTVTRSVTIREMSIAVEFCDGNHVSWKGLEASSCDVLIRVP
jgi:hypothetical protein